MLERTACAYRPRNNRLPSNPLQRLQRIIRIRTRTPSYSFHLLYHWVINSSLLVHRLGDIQKPDRTIQVTR